jgi:phage gp36-like protein
MNYFELTDLEALIPPKTLTQALDDDNDGVAEQFDFVRTSAQETVDTILSVRFLVPFTGTIPKIVKRAALVVAASLCYSRRGFTGAQNPFESAAEAFTSTKQGHEGLLVLIAKGKLPLNAATAESSESEPIPPGSIVTYDSPLGEPTRRLA